MDVIKGPMVYIPWIHDNGSNLLFFKIQTFGKPVDGGFGGTVGATRSWNLVAKRKLDKPGYFLH